VQQAAVGGDDVHYGIGTVRAGGANSVLIGNTLPRERRAHAGSDVTSNALPTQVVMESTSFDFSIMGLICNDCGRRRAQRQNVLLGVYADRRTRVLSEPHFWLAPES